MLSSNSVEMSQEDGNFPVLQNTLSSLRMHRLWPKSNQTSPLKFRLMYLITLICCSPNWIGIIAHLTVVIKGNLDVDISEDLAMITSMIGLLFHLISYVLQQRKIAKLYLELSDFVRFGKPDNFDVVNKRLNFYSRLFSYYCGIGIWIYGIIKVLEKPKCLRNNREKHLNEVCGVAFNVWMPFNVNFSPAREVIFLVQICGAILFMKGGANISFGTYEVAQHIVLRIKHLNRLLREAFDDGDVNVCRRRLNNCIKYHSYIIRMHETFDECCKDANGSYILIAAVIFGCIATQMQNSPVGIIHLGGWVISLYIRCSAGQAVMSESLTIATAAYESQWYQRGIHLQRDLLLVIERSQKPFYLHARPLGIMSLSLFIALMKTSYSYYTLLSQSL